MKHILTKLSAPGWEKTFLSEMDAKAVLYSHVCNTCLIDIAFEQVGGRSAYFMSPEDKELWMQCHAVEEYECSIDDLLGSACGCEFYYEVEDKA